MSPIALWITGLPGSGKSTLAEGIKEIHPHFIILRMDELRKIVTPEPTYSEGERDLVYRCLVYTAYALVKHGHSVIIDATGNLKRWRELARRLIGRYGEIYLKCPLDLCVSRERKRAESHGAPRDIYAKSGAGAPVPGVSAPYEEPFNPELLIETDQTSISEAVRLTEGIIKKLEAKEAP
ncbi:MAG TPA: adenylyl-sulfate kinase [Thermodesulfovibrionales bacterium]|jgi:adenylylsulfate kinase|nr:adenylyl-sulfate kinase [Thermodesulfovibrionales bacterium]